MKTPHLLLLGLGLTAALPVCGQGAMNIDQTLSDQAQAMTIAFDGLAFLTGSTGADSFLPPGKVADFSGFQYLRDNDPTQMGHNTDFVTIIARNVLNILSPAQVQQLVDRAGTQLDLINQYGTSRFPLMQAFRRRLNGDLPDGCAELDWAAVTAHSADLYQLDGLISLDRAQLFGEILRNLTATQKSALSNLASLQGIGHWPTNLSDPLQGLHLSPDLGVGVMTYASEMFSWYAGSVEADVYFCPERQGTYFGSFYLKDAPAMGNPGYSIGTNVTADSGNAFLAVLSDAQRAQVTNLVTVQKPYLRDIVNTRSNIAVQLRGYLVTNHIDTNAVIALCRRYGELDGMIVYSYATHFAHVRETLASQQQASLAALRLQMLGTNLLYPAGGYLYSAPIPLPAPSDTQKFFSFLPANRLPLEDTGQVLGSLPLFGEDADYLLNPPAFSVTHGVVFDAITGRMWQQADGGEMTWEAATQYAESLVLAGHTDWRLPTAHESFGILNHGVVNPALDTAVFTASAAGYWWSQDPQAGNGSNVWVVNAGGGVGPHPRAETLSAGGVKRFHVRCVRGAPAPAPFALSHHFTDNADGTVTDLDTGLTWQQVAGSAVDWTNALAYADSLALAEHTDWRLPNIKELQSLNDETRTTPTLDTNFFPAALAAVFWSSTTLVGGTNSAWTMDFRDGIGSYAAKTSNLPVRCVRGGGTSTVTAPGAYPVCLASGLGFTEGPAADAGGNVCFSDVTGNTVYRWSLDGSLAVVRTNSGGANGLVFDRLGNLLACEGAAGRITCLSPSGELTERVAGCDGVRFNEPNDLWVDPAGGFYFTDPVFLGHPITQGGEHVYYLAPGATNATRVLTDLVKPNGLTGSADGQFLYVADWGASVVYRYRIAGAGVLVDKMEFAKVRCDGMTVDAAGRLYCCENAVRVFDAAGLEVGQIAIPERPTNVEFGGSQHQYLFVTTEAGSLYAQRMSQRGINAFSPPSPPVIEAPSITPAVPSAGLQVGVAARVLGDAPIASVTLHYSRAPARVFSETMGTTETKPWTGGGCDQPWAVGWKGSNPFEQRLASQQGEGNPCGLQFKLGTTNLEDSSLTTAGSLDTRGVTGSIGFWLWSDGLSGDMGWAMQLDHGEGFTTRLSELSGLNHGWQSYHYELLPDDRVNGLRLRFQFRGGTNDPRMDLDAILVQVEPGSEGAGSVRMLDDGVHQDGDAADGVYGAWIPAQPVSASLRYYLTAVDALGAAATWPAGAPETTAAFSVTATAPDTMGDGVPDWWRARFFGGNGTTTNALSSAGADPDGDGMDNVQEYLADTCPTNAQSVFSVRMVASADGVSLAYPTSVNRRYTAYLQTNIADGSWAAIPGLTDVAGDGASGALKVPEAGLAQSYFRIGARIP